MAYRPIWTFAFPPAVASFPMRSFPVLQPALSQDVKDKLQYRAGAKNWLPLQLSGNCQTIELYLWSKSSWKTGPFTSWEGGYLL